MVSTLNQAVELLQKVFQSVLLCGCTTTWLFPSYTKSYIIVFIDIMNKHISIHNKVSVMLIFFYISVFFPDCGCDKHSWNLHYYKWYHVCHRLCVCEATGLQSSHCHRISGGHSHLQGFSQPEGRQGWTKPTWEVLQAVHRFVSDCYNLSKKKIIEDT